MKRKYRKSLIKIFFSIFRFAFICIMSQPEKKLFLLDAFALIYRAYYAFIKNPRINSKGLNTSAMFGFTNTLLEVLEKEKPTHIAVIFDTSAPTERHTDFADYKAHREETPEDISRAIPYIIKIIEAFNIPAIGSDGFEADDVIGTLAKKAEQAGFTTFMMTPDKDFGQLVSDKIFIYKPARFGNGAEVMGVKEVCEKFEIQNPLQVIDILGLMGDAVDNIPGVPGIGEKTAKKLIAEFGSIENLLQNTAQLKGAIKEKIETNVDKALLSKKLATILLNAPVELDEKKFQIGEPNKEALKEIFADLEFRRLGERIFGITLPEKEKGEGKKEESENKNGQFGLFDTEISESAEGIPEPVSNITLQNINTVSHQYFLTNTEEKINALIELLSQQKSFCFDTETTGLDTQKAELVGISFSVKPLEAYFVPVPENQEETKHIVGKFKTVFENETIEKTGQNIKYDISVLKKYDVEVRGKFFDTMLAHYLIQPDMRHGMDLLSETYLNYKPVSIISLIGPNGKKQKSMREIPVEQVSEYGAEDADVTLQLKNVFEPMLEKVNAKKLFEEVESPLISVLSAMEAEGIRLNTDALKELSKGLTVDIVNLGEKIFEIAGTTFNIDSPRQVGEVLFEKLKVVEKPKKTKTGQYATGEDILTSLLGTHPIIEKILDFRELQKLKNTYVDTLPEMINPRTGKIHTSYNQIVAATGRLSSDNPNLQNIPIRTERGREIRKAFVPRNDDFVLLSADYSQIELRIIAELSKDEGMIQAFNQGHDIHTATAAKVYRIDIAEVTSEMRRNAKMVNFGIIYGISAFGLSQRLGIPRKEAKEIIDNYFIEYPRIKAYMDESIVFAREHGYVETILGRRRYLRDINSANFTVRGFAERNAINAPIQGSAADMIKVAMITIHKEFSTRNFKSKMLLQVHDELVFDAHKDEVEQIKPVIEEKMKNAIPMKVPIVVEMGTGTNWLEAH